MERGAPIILYTVIILLFFIILYFVEIIFQAVTCFEVTHEKFDARRQARWGIVYEGSLRELIKFLFRKIDF